MKKAGVYKIEHVASGRCYIGSSKNIRQRFGSHRTTLRRGIHHSRKLQASWNKHGEAAFKFSTLLICSEANLLFYEQRLIDGFNAASVGFNILPLAGSPVGAVMPDTWKQNVKAAHRAIAKKLPWRGGMYCLTEIAEMEGFSYRIFSCRVLEYGWSLERAASTPVEKRRLTLTALGRTQRMTDWAKELRCRVSTLGRWLSAGETIESFVVRHKVITLKELAELGNVSAAMVWGRVRRGWDIADALSVPSRAPPPPQYAKQQMTGDFFGAQAQ
jgi:GIY-YIG catalytic domain